jgi:hypothetical protein
MSSINLTEARAKLKTWMDADDSLAFSQSYSIDVGGTKRVLTRADAKQVQDRINYWRKEVERLERGTTAPRVRLVIPRD